MAEKKTQKPTGRATLTNRLTTALRNAKQSKNESKPELKVKSPSYTSDEVCSWIRETAYDIYQRRGGFHGYDQFDWTTAEKIVTAQLNKQLGKRNGGSNPANEKKIAEKAYELSLQRNQAHGGEQFDWYLAQKLVG